MKQNLSTIRFAPKANHSIPTCSRHTRARAYVVNFVGNKKNKSLDHTYLWCACSSSVTEQRRTKANKMLAKVARKKTTQPPAKKSWQQQLLLLFWLGKLS